MHAMRIAPGLRRRFSAEKWSWLPQKVWQQERHRAFDLIQRDATFHAYGSDIDPEAVELAQHNAKQAGRRRAHRGGAAGHQGLFDPKRKKVW